MATKRRLELLKGDDMAAYLREVSSAKSGQIQRLLAQTDGCLRELMKRLQQKRPNSALAPTEDAGFAKDHEGKLAMLFCFSVWVLLPRYIFAFELPKCLGLGLWLKLMVSMLTFSL